MTLQGVCFAAARQQTKTTMKKTAEEKKQDKIQKQIAASIKRANARYRKASPAQRRVMIAKDVIKMLEAKQIKAGFGTFVDPVYDYHMSDAVFTDDGVSLQALIHGVKLAKNPTPLCEVCGIGAMFVSAVGFRNECMVDLEGGVVGGQETALERLSEFSTSQRQLIEMAFETGKGWHSTNGWNWPSVELKPTKLRAAAESYSKLAGLDRGSKELLIAICKNIIKHGGRFNPLVK